MPRINNFPLSKIATWNVYSKVYFTDNCESLRTRWPSLLSLLRHRPERETSKRTLRKRNQDNFILIPLLSFLQGAIVLVPLDRHSRYTRYNVISSLNDHVETNGGKRKKKMR